MNKWVFRLTFALLMNLGLGSEALGQTKFRLFDTVIAKGTGITPAKGDLYYTSGTSGVITALPIGSSGDCLTVSGAGAPQWTPSASCGTGGGGGSITFTAPSQYTVTGSPGSTIGLTWNNQSQNFVLAGPLSGSGAPSFRALAAEDLGITNKGDLVTFSTVLTRLGVGVDGYVLTADAAQTTGLKWAAAGSGTVTSVGLSLPAFITVTGTPVTTTGTLTGTLAVQNKNKFFGGPSSGTDVAPTFRLFSHEDFGITTKGDLLTFAPGMTRLAVGTDGYVLMADSVSAAGVKWAPAGGAGTVTSVGLSLAAGGTALYTVTGSPVTGSGTLTLNLVSVNSGQFYKGNGSNQWAIDYIQPTDYPLATITNRGALPTLDNNTAHYLRGDGSWQTPPGAGTVTSVGLSLTSLAWLSITGSPVTTSGTLALNTVGGQTANHFLSTPDGSTGSVSLRGIAQRDLAFAGFSASGLSHSSGAVPDPGAVAGITKFLREDATWTLPPQGTVTSVDASVPAFMTIAGNPISSSGTLAFGFGSENANMIFAGPTTGAAATPTWRALVPADYPIFIASGATHAAGAVPDPGVTGGTTKFLREDASWQTPTFSSSIEVKQVDGLVDVTGVSILRFNQTDGFTVTDNGSGIATIACSSCAGPGTTATKQDLFNGNSSTTVFGLSSTPSTNGIIYVALNGLPQRYTTDWTVSGSNITMASAPITGALLEVGYYTALPGSVTHIQEDFTGAAATDFTLAHAPATNGILLVTLRGLIQPQTTWSIVSSTTLRFTSAVPTGDIVSISYNY